MVHYCRLQVKFGATMNCNRGKVKKMFRLRKIFAFNGVDKPGELAWINELGT